MLGFVAYSVILSVDSFVAAFGLAPFMQRAASRYRSAAWFGVCDMLGTLASGSESARLASTALPPVAAASGLFLVALALVFRSHGGRRRPASAWPLLALLPILLGIDNLALPLPPDMPWLIGAGTVGVTSAVLALAGANLGTLVAASGRTVPGHAYRQGSARTWTRPASPTLHPSVCPLLASLILILS